MKRGLFLLCLLIIYPSIVTAGGFESYFVVKESSPAEDAILLTNIIQDMAGDIGTNYATRLTSEVTRDQLENRVTLFIHNGSALIIVGAHSPSEQIILATKIMSLLKSKYGIVALGRISSEIMNDDLSKERLVYCTDTDGPEVYTKGEVIWTESVIDESGNYGRTTAFRDECESPLRLIEFSCADNLHYQSTETECSYGCTDGACLPFYGNQDKIDLIEEELDSSVDCPPRSCKTVSEACVGSDKFFREECTIFIRTSDACEDNLITTTRMLINACAEEEVNPRAACQGCLIDEATCIPYGTRLAKKDVPYYCDISKTMTEQKEDRQTCQNSYECSSNNCKSGVCAPVCMGCLDNNRVCIPIGTRTETEYCDTDYDFKEQRAEDIRCNNHYECSTNICVDNQCISPSLIRKIIDWLKRLLG